jgi:hypothetical protein
MVAKLGTSEIEEAVRQTMAKTRLARYARRKA